MTKDTNCQGCAVQQGTHNPAEALIIGQDPYASEEESRSVISKREPSIAEKMLYAMFDARGAFDQGSDAAQIMHNIAIKLIEDEASLLRELAACRTTVENLERKVVVNREAVLSHLDELLDDAAAHIYPSDLQKCQASECTVTVASVRIGNRYESSIPLFSREQVAEALDAAIAASAAQGEA